MVLCHLPVQHPDINYLCRQCLYVFVPRHSCIDSITSIWYSYYQSCTTSEWCISSGQGWIAALVFRAVWSLLDLCYFYITLILSHLLALPVRSVFTYLLIIIYYKNCTRSTKYKIKCIQLSGGTKWCRYCTIRSQKSHNIKFCPAPSICSFKLPLWVTLLNSLLFPDLIDVCRLLGPELEDLCCISSKSMKLQTRLHAEKNVKAPSSGPCLWALA